MVSVKALMEDHLVWIKVLESCFFLPQEDWKHWKNPWGSKLSFAGKNEEPSYTKEEVDLENLIIWDAHFFEPLEEALKRAVWVFGGLLNKEQWVYIDDGLFVKLHHQGQVYNPLHLGKQILIRHIEQPENNKFTFKIPKSLSNWSELFMGKPEEIRRWLK